MRKINHIGREFGLLKVVAATGKTKFKNKSHVYLCQCQCGNTKEISTAEFSSAVSCGCAKKLWHERFAEARRNKSPITTLPLGESTHRSIFRSYFCSARKRGLAFELTPADFRSIITQDCHYCGKEPSQFCKDVHRPEGSIMRNGIDRVDNSQGYLKQNCVPCCKVCNRAKDVMTSEEFRDWVNRISARLADWAPPA